MEHLSNYWALYTFILLIGGLFTIVLLTIRKNENKRRVWNKDVKLGNKYRSR